MVAFLRRRRYFVKMFHYHGNVGRPDTDPDDTVRFLHTENLRSYIYVKLHNNSVFKIKYLYFFLRATAYML